MEVYLDNSATTMPCKAAVAAMTAAAENFGNPSSKHKNGMRAAEALNSARRTVANKMGVQSEEIFFVSCGSEADNIAVLGGANAKKGKKIVTSAVEHPAVLVPMKNLEQQGFEVVYVYPHSDGNVYIDDIESALDRETSLVSFMHVNNETGAVLPVDKIKAIIERKCPKALFHIDAVQSFGKTDVAPLKWGADLVSISAHKIHGVKGVGALYKKRGVNVKPVIYGGGQEGGISSGTQNMPGIMAFEAAVKELPKDNSTAERLAFMLTSELKKIEGVIINSPHDALPNIISVSFGKIPSEVVLNIFSAEGIYISSGSACAALKSERSHVLRAQGAKNLEQTVRISLDHTTTEDEIVYTLQAVKNKILPFMERIGDGRR